MRQSSMSKHPSVRLGSSERAGNCTCLLRDANAIAQFTAIATPKFPGPYRIRARLCIFASTRLKWQRRVRIRHTQPARLCFCDSRLPISRPSLPAAPPLKMRGSRRATNVNEPKRSLRKKRHLRPGRSSIPSQSIQERWNISRKSSARTLQYPPSTMPVHITSSERWHLPPKPGHMRTAEARRCSRLPCQAPRAETDRSPWFAHQLSGPIWTPSVAYDMNITSSHFN
jgi:hypothetical protein